MRNLNRWPPSFFRNFRPADPMQGIHMVGDYQAATGLGVAMRSLASALRHAGIPLAHTQVDLATGRRTDDHLETDLAPGDCDTALYHVNGDKSHDIALKACRALRRPKRRIGYWYWELPDFPEAWKARLGDLDELWVATRYVQEHAAAISPVPVVRIPPPIPIPQGTARREAFDLPGDRFIFLFMFEPSSSVARKNPFAIIQAFQKAFAGVTHPPLLVMKTHHLRAISRHVELARDLEAALASVGGRMIDASWERGQLVDFIASCDAFVSLHRAEGLGLGVAEAMALGKPVIATGYSGNTDFMTPDNSYAVAYRMRRITEEDHRYQPVFTKIYTPGQWWADPDTTHAAACMRQVWEHPAEAHNRAERARETIRSEYSMDAIATKIRARFAETKAWR